MYIWGIDDEQCFDIEKMSAFPIFEVIYFAENENCSKRAEGGFMCKKELNIYVKVLVKLS